MSPANPSAARLIVGAAVLLLVWGCSPTAPSPSRSTTTTTSKGIINVKISGASTIAPGNTAQLSASATHADGTSQDVTTTVQWHSSDTSILTISATGLASGIQAGDILVTATLSPGVAATQMILVVPAGTFRLSGVVRGLGGFLDGALVQVTAGIGAGLSSSTAGGTYRLYGVAGNIQVTVSKTSDVPATQALTVDSNTVLDFDLVTVNPPPDLVGTYTLRITADPGCATAGDGALPAIGREREYTATIQPSGGNGIRAGLSGANFLPNSTKSWLRAPIWTTRRAARWCVPAQSGARSTTIPPLIELERLLAASRAAARRQ
jgi:hypothetical protein